MFDGPIFSDEGRVKSGWVNVAQFPRYQSVGLYWPTRDAAINICKRHDNVVYRIHVKVKERSDNARDSF